MKSGSKICDWSKWISIILFLLILPVVSFYFGFQVAKLDAVQSQLTIVDDFKLNCVFRR